jgi:hypothetical protein
MEKARIEKDITTQMDNWKKDKIKLQKLIDKGEKDRENFKKKKIKKFINDKKTKFKKSWKT